MKRMIGVRSFGRRPLLALITTTTRREYNFGSSKYAAAFDAPRPSVDTAALRLGAVAYLEAFDQAANTVVKGEGEGGGHTGSSLQHASKSAWGTNDPIVTVLRGKRWMPGGAAAAAAALSDEAEVGLDPGAVEVDTHDAFGKVTGRQLLASVAAVDAVADHCNAIVRANRDAGCFPTVTGGSGGHFGGGGLGRGGGRGGEPVYGVDLRGPVRAAEAALLEDVGVACALIGNQALDFGKQDGVTEIEEALEANPIERAMVDALLLDEQRGILTLNRDPVLVACVSNFSNFLDLCRKVLRHLECGVPVVVLSRNGGPGGAGQHVYRWCRLLQAALEKEGGVDPGMVTFLSADLAGQRRLMAATSPHCAVHLTGSRAAAGAVKALSPASACSTGGPNTMVATQWTPAVSEATRLAAQIENSGQCTAMRHLVCPGVGAPQLEACFGAEAEQGGGGEQGGEEEKQKQKHKGKLIGSAVEALRAGTFDGLYESWGASFDSSPAVASGAGYSRHPDKAVPVAWRLHTGDGGGGGEWGLPPLGLEEYWRRVVLDVSSPPAPTAPMGGGGSSSSSSSSSSASGGGVRSPAFLRSLSQWLVKEQPITVAVNDNDAKYTVAKALFENTCQVVFSVGGTGQSASQAAAAAAPPALTCQARPQDGEVFGEFPPRQSMGNLTSWPVVVPSATPALAARLNPRHLAARVNSPFAAVGSSEEEEEEEELIPSVAQRLASAVLAQDPSVVGQVRAGYLLALGAYLGDAAHPTATPRAGKGHRTSLWGLQRPPLEGGDTVLRFGSKFRGGLGVAAAYVLPFLATNAAPTLVVSIHPDCALHLVESLQQAAGASPLYLKVEASLPPSSRERAWNVVAFGDDDDDDDGRGGGGGGGEAAAARVAGGAGTAAAALADVNRLPLPGPFVSLLLPLGHIKSTLPDDTSFLDAFRASPKWLKVKLDDDGGGGGGGGGDDPWPETTLSMDR